MFTEQKQMDLNLPSKNCVVQSPIAAWPVMLVTDKWLISLRSNTSKHSQSTAKKKRFMWPRWQRVSDRLSFFFKCNCFFCLCLFLCCIFYLVCDLSLVFEQKWLPCTWSTDSLWFKHTVHASMWCSVPGSIWKIISVWQSLDWRKHKNNTVHNFKSQR